MRIFPRYISNHLHGLFAGAWDLQTKDPLPVDIPLPIPSKGMIQDLTQSSLYKISIITELIHDCMFELILNYFVSSLSVDECVRLVSKSIRPVIILGSQSTLPPVPAEKLRQALEVT